jgi:hypothetical protein
MCNDELYNLHTSQNVIRVIQFRTMKCVRHVARAGKITNAHTILVKYMEGRKHFGHLYLDDRTLLKQILQKYDIRMRTGSIYLRIVIRGEILFIHL